MSQASQQPPDSASASWGPSNGGMLSVDHLACRRGGRLLFRLLSFSLLPRQLMWLRGSNGRGKTSLLRLLAGLARPDEGSIRFAGFRPRDAAYDARLVYIAHANALKDDLSVIESLGFLARLHGQRGARAELLPALKMMGLASRRDAPVRTLSQGQRRRVALARLLLEPEKPLWLLDEPYDALDADGIVLLNEVLSAHVQRGGSVLLTSHLPLGIQEPQPLQLNLDEAAA